MFARVINAASHFAGELRVYNEQHLVSVTKLSSPVNAMTFGKFGREDNTLISITRKGEHTALSDLLTFLQCITLAAWIHADEGPGACLCIIW